MIFKSNVKLCPTCIVCLFFSKQCKLYKSIIFFIDLQGFVISGTVIFLAVNPHLDLYIDYSIRYKKPHPIVIYTVYIIFFKLQFFCLEYNDGHLIVEYTMGNRAGMWILTPHFSEVCTIEQCSYDLRSYKSCVFIPRRIKLRCSEKYQHSTHGRFLGLNLTSLIFSCKTFGDLLSLIISNDSPWGVHGYFLKQQIFFKVIYNNMIQYQGNWNTCI